MLHYDLEHISGRSLYEKLTDCIRTDIRNGVLRAGTKLPSKRRAAVELGVSVVTVQGAYDQLLAEGYITSVERSGYFVAQIESRPSETPPPVRGALEEASDGTAPFETVPSPAPRAEDRNVIDMVQSALSPDLFPLSVWTRLSHRVYSDEGANLLRRVPYNGLLPLREAIADILFEIRGIRTTPENIVVSAGNEQLYSVLLAYFGRDAVFGVEDPGHRLISRLYEENGAAVRYLPLDEHGVMPEALERSGANILHISPAHHFPTGVVTPIGRRQELLAWAERQGGYIIEDDYDSEFRMAGRPIPSLQEMDRAGRVIYINTFSKTIAPALRIAYAVLPPALAADYRDRFGFLSCPVTAAEQLILANFIREGYFERHINRMRTRYRTLRDALLTAIQSSPKAHRYKVTQADGGLHFLLHIDTACPDSALREAAAAAGIRVHCLSDYAHTPADTHTLVISYAGLPEGLVGEFVGRLDGLEI